MRNRRIRSLTALLPLVGILLPAFLFAACAPESDPFNVGDRARLDAEATAAAASGATTVPVLTDENSSILPDEGKGTVRFADWSDKEISLLNNMAGYIIVWGYDYKVDLVDVNEAGYQAAVSKGEVDVVMGVSKATDAAWLKQQTDSGAMIDTGSIYGPDSDLRIAAKPAIKTNALEVFEFLQKMTADKEIIANTTAQISEGRTGIKPVVATLIFLKANEAIWTQWVPALVAENVRSAINGGRTSLLKRDCIPTGGSRSAGNPNEANC